MKFSRESEYGLKGLLFLVKQPQEKVLSLHEIAVGSNLPQSFLAKIFHKFVQHGLLKSFRGATRGYALGRSPKAISAREILEAIEGPDLFERCIFWNDRCDGQDPCPLHDGWKAVKPQFVSILQKATLHDLAQGHSWLKPLQRKGGSRSSRAV